MFCIANKKIAHCAGPVFRHIFKGKVECLREKFFVDFVGNIQLNHTVEFDKIRSDDNERLLLPVDTSG